MRTKIQTTKPDRISEHEFHTDHIHLYYNFASGEIGDVLINKSFIEDLYNKKLKEGWGVAEDLLNFLKTVAIDDNSHYNINVYLIDGKIQCKVGYYLKKIKNNIEMYEKYASQREMETVLMFTLIG